MPSVPSVPMLLLSAAKESGAPPSAAGPLGPCLDAAPKFALGNAAGPLGILCLNPFRMLWILGVFYTRIFGGPVSDLSDPTTGLPCTQM